MWFHVDIAEARRRLVRLLIGYLVLLAVALALLSAFVPLIFSLSGVVRHLLRIVLDHPFCESILLRSIDYSGLELKVFHMWVLMLDALKFSFDGVQSLTASQRRVRRRSLALN